MAWNDSKVANNDILSSDWNAMVSDQNTRFKMSSFNSTEYSGGYSSETTIATYSVATGPTGVLIIGDIWAQRDSYYNSVLKVYTGASGSETLKATYTWVSDGSSANMRFGRTLLWADTTIPNGTLSVVIKVSSASGRNVGISSIAFLKY